MRIKVLFILSLEQQRLGGGGGKGSSMIRGKGILVGQTYDGFELSIPKPPTAKARLSCPNDFFVDIFGKNDESLSRQIT